MKKPYKAQKTSITFNDITLLEGFNKNGIASISVEKLTNLLNGAYIEGMIGYGSSIGNETDVILSKIKD